MNPIFSRLTLAQSSAQAFPVPQPPQGEKLTLLLEVVRQRAICENPAVLLPPPPVELELEDARLPPSAGAREAPSTSCCSIEGSIPANSDKVRYKSMSSANALVRCPKLAGLLGSWIISGTFSAVSNSVCLQYSQCSPSCQPRDYLRGEQQDHTLRNPHTCR